MKRTGKLAMLMGSVFLIVLAATVGLAAEADQITLKWAQPYPPKGPCSETMQWMADEITRRTKGRVKFEMFWSCSLLTLQDQVPGVGRGAADLSHVISSFTISQNPHWTTLQMGYGHDLWVLLWAPWDMLTNSAEIQAEFDKLNIVPIHGYSAGTNYWIFKKPVTTLKDLKGVRFRSWGPAVTKISAQLKMVPVPTPLSEVYMSLDKGVIAGACGGFQTIYTQKWFEIAKHFTLTPIQPTTCINTIMNKDRWESLSQETRDIFIQVGIEFNDKYMKRIIQDEARIRRELETDHGVQFHNFAPDAKDAYLEANKAYQEDWFNKWDPKGMKTRAVYEELMQLVRKYEQEVKEKGYPWEMK
jgi:TRAP-type C4-dicarboxylate transport system substrate-binding protein